MGNVLWNHLKSQHVKKQREFYVPEKKISSFFSRLFLTRARTKSTDKSCSHCIVADVSCRFCRCVCFILCFVMCVCISYLCFLLLLLFVVIMLNISLSRIIRPIKLVLLAFVSIFVHIVFHCFFPFSLVLFGRDCMNWAEHQCIVTSIWGKINFYL